MASDLTMNQALLDRSKNTFNYDDFLEHIGHVGPFQRRATLLLCWPAFFFGIIIMCSTFTGAVPRYRCYVDGCENLTETEFQPAWINHTIPWYQTDPELRQCRRYNHTWIYSTQCVEGNVDIDGTSLMKCQQWVYDSSLFHSTIVTDFHLTCDEEWKLTFCNTLYMIGMLVGASTLGNLSDVVGRKKSYTMITFLLAMTVTLSAFATDFWTYSILRFLCGVFNIGFFLVLFVWGVEAVGQDYRVLCGLIYNMITSVGSILLGVTAYFVRDWRTLQLIIGLPMFSLLILHWCVPESIRWLITKKKYTEARKLILWAAEMNGKSIPRQFLTRIDQDKNVNIHENERARQNVETIFDIFRSPLLFKRAVIMFAAWMGSLLGYYGITYSATNLSGSFFTNYVLSMLMEPPSMLFAMFVMDRFGRKPTLAGSLIICGLSCFMTGFTTKDMPSWEMMFSLTSKFFISVVTGTLFSYTAELFPTSTRSSALGICSSMGKVGAILAPSLAEMGRKSHPALPYFVFGIVNLTVGSFCLMLPETNKTRLPATIQEANDINKYSILVADCDPDEETQEW